MCLPVTVYLISLELCWKKSKFCMNVLYCQHTNPIPIVFPLILGSWYLQKYVYFSTFTELECGLLACVMVNVRIYRNNLILWDLSLPQMGNEGFKITYWGRGQEYWPVPPSARTPWVLRTTSLGSAFWGPQSRPVLCSGRWAVAGSWWWAEPAVHRGLQWFLYSEKV